MRGHPHRQLARFCPTCGGKLKLGVPRGEHESRHICTACRKVTYFNPKMIVGVICEHRGRILMIKRATPPEGRWTLPAGFLELGESSAEGAARETLEEARARVEIVAPFVHFDIPHAGQAYVIFRAKLLPPYEYGPSPESLKTELMRPQDIPIDEVAFSSVSLALYLYMEDLKAGAFSMHHAVIGSPPQWATNPYSLRTRLARLQNHMIVEGGRRETEVTERLRERDATERLRERDATERLRERDAAERLRERDVTERLRSRTQPLEELPTCRLECGQDLLESEDDSL